MTRTSIGTRLIFSGILVSAILALPCVGEEPDNPAQPASKDVSKDRSAATIERIMDQAVRGIGRRYNLNAAQLEKTDAIMRQGVRKFLHDHEDQVWPAIRDILTSPKGPADPESAKRISKIAGPLVALAKQAILDGNAEWRLILTPEQKRTHDFDLSEMNKQFEQIEKNFADWGEGKTTEGGVFPKSDPESLARRSPPMPKRPAGNKLPSPEQRMFDIDFFDTIVAEFIKDYGLDEGQISSARSILKEFKDKALSFMNANRSDFAKILAAQEHALQVRDRDKSRRAEALRKRLLEPVYTLVSGMQNRLQSLPTSAQQARYEANQRADRSLSRKIKEQAIAGKDGSIKDAPAPAQDEKQADAKKPTEDKEN